MFSFHSFPKWFTPLESITCKLWPERQKRMEVALRYTYSTSPHCSAGNVPFLQVVGGNGRSPPCPSCCGLSATPEWEGPLSFWSDPGRQEMMPDDSLLSSTSQSPTPHTSEPGTGGRHKHNCGIDINSSGDVKSQSLRRWGENQGKYVSGKKTEWGTWKLCQKNCLHSSGKWNKGLSWLSNQWYLFQIPRHLSFWGRSWD